MQAHPSLSGVTTLVTLAVAGALVSGCESPMRALGLEKAPPDEFVVVGRAPLSLPPDYRLRPPSPGAARGGEALVVDQARQAVFGIAPAAGLIGANPVAAPLRAGMSPGEANLLARADAGAADPNIRQVVDRESAVLVGADENFLDRLLHWRDPALAGTVVNADAEARRLRETQALGVPATTGDTPVIERKQRWPLEGLF